MNELSVSDQRRASRPGHDENGRFKAGNTFSTGRPKGSRNKLGEQFIDDLYQDWREGGIEAIKRMRRDNPTAYVQTVARVLPKQLEIEVRQSDGLSDDQLDELMMHYQGRLLELKAAQTDADKAMLTDASEAFASAELDETGGLSNADRDRAVPG
jgi:hypothetical protein